MYRPIHFTKVSFTLIICIFIFFGTAGAQETGGHLSNARSDRQKADTLFSLAMKHFRTARFDSACYLLKKGIAFAQNTGNDNFIAHYYLSLGNAQILNNDPGEGLISLKKATPYLNRISNYDLRIKYLVFGAMAFSKMHNIDSALNYYHRGELLNDVENPYNNWIIYSQIAMMYQQAQAFGQAEKYFSKAYKLAKAKGIRMDQGIILYRFSNLYFEWGKPGKYAELLNEQQKFVQSGKKNYSIDPVHNMLFGDWQKKPFHEKVIFMERVKKELIKRGSFSNAALANVYLAELYEENGQHEKALVFVQENQKLLHGEKDLVNHYINTKLLYQLLKKTGRAEDAIVQADKLFSLKDSILSLQQRKTMLDLETKYETQRKEKDIELLNAENELSTIRLAKETDLREALMRENLLKDSVVNREKDYNKLLANENRLIEFKLKNEQQLKAAITRENFLKENQLAKEKRNNWLIISGAALLLLLGSGIYIMYRRQKSKNSLIQKQADDLQMLMKEIHHRVKNNLQVISSLLDLQSLTIGDRHASEAIKESRNRVYSMALIHQNLYREENIRGIDMPGYIHKLVQSLLQSYNAGDNKIKLETDIDSLSLDVDMVIPIGLGLNELISNSLKYAFNNTNEGTLQIALKKSDEELLLKVHDNGSGFPNGLNVWQTKSFGYKLIKAFAQKLKARLEVYNDNGACILLHIKKIKFA